MKQVKKYSKKVLVSILIFLQLVMYAVVSFADSYAPSIHGEAIAQYARQQVTANYPEMIYDDKQEFLDLGVNGEAAPDGFRHYVCDSYIRFIYRQVLGNTGVDSIYGASSFYHAIGGDLFEKIDPSEAMPGDILAVKYPPGAGATGHVKIYLGNNEAAHASSSKHGHVKVSPTIPGETVEKNGVKCQYIVGRLKSTVDVKLLTPLDSMGGKNTNYNYYGMPTAGEYTGTKKLSFKWIFSKISQFADYLIGFITMGIKAVVIGWTTIFERLVTSVIEAATQTSIEQPEEEQSKEEDTEENTENSENEEGENLKEGEDLYIPSAVETYINEHIVDNEERLTVEKIIYNQVPILDIDVFERDYAGGQKLTEEGTIATIRNNIAAWYYVFRTAAIIIMLVVLVYAGIRMAMSSIGEEKAKYKRLLVDWFMGFAIVFFIHYFIIIMIGINNELIGIFQNAKPSGEYTLYDTVRTKAYELKFTSGLVGTVMYVYLVYLLIRFLFIYFKRYLAVNILIIIAPIIGLTYAIDKVKDGKSQSLGLWGKDLFFNIIIQSVHALIYTSIIQIALDISGDSLAGVVIAMIILNFMLKADKIFMYIFNIRGESLRDVLKEDTIKNAVVAMQFIKKGWISKMATAPIRYGVNLAKGAAGIVTDLGGIFIPQNTQFRYNRWYNQQMEHLWGKGNYIRRRTSNIEIKSDIEKKQEKEIKKRKELTKKVLKQNIKFGTGMVKGFTQAVVAVPLTIATPAAGITLGLNAMTTFRKYSRGDHPAPYFNTTKAKKNIAGYKEATTQNTKEAKKAKRKYRRRAVGKTLIAPVMIGTPAWHTIQRYQQNQANLESKINRIKESPNRAKILEEERQTEEELAFLYNALTKEKLVDTDEDDPLKDKLDKKLKEKKEKEFDHVVNETLKDVRDSDIKEAIERYKNSKSISKLNRNDIKGILKELKDVTKKSKIEFTPEMEKEIERQMKELSDELIKNNMQESMQRAKDKDALTKIEDKHVVEELKASKVVEEFRKTMSKTTDKVTLNKEFDNLLKRENVGENLTEKAKERIVERAIDEKERHKTGELKTEEVIKVIKKSTRNKQTIKRETPPSEYDAIVEKLEEMKRLNNLFDDTFKEPIHKNLVSAAKKAKENKEFDFYQSLLKRNKKNK